MLSEDTTEGRLSFQRYLDGYLLGAIHLVYFMLFKIFNFQLLIKHFAITIINFIIYFFDQDSQDIFLIYINNIHISIFLNNQTKIELMYQYIC